MTRWCRGCAGTLLLLTLAALSASAATPKRVLILDPFGRDVAPFSTATAAFRATLARQLGEPLDVYELPLELARSEEPEGEAPLVALLENRVKSHPLDLVALVGGAGAQFAVRHRDRLFPNTPVLLIGADARFVPPNFLRTNVTLIAQKVNLKGMVEDILQLQPQTTNIVVVFGASALEKAWVNECRREFQSFTNRVDFTWLNDLSLDEIVKRCTTLPPHSFILQPLFVVDAAGVPSERDEALRRLHQAANAPIFAYPASELGQGSIGGRLVQDVELGVQAARIAVRLLRGENPANIPHQALEVGTPVYDWRELRRWGISEARLPAGSVIQFREPTFWKRYHWLVIGTAVFCLLQAALIIGLLVNRAKRRQAEAAATLLADISSKFVNLPPGEVDREIMDAERRICELLGLDVSSLWEWLPESPEVLVMTHRYRLVEGPPALQKMTAGEYFPWCQDELRAGRNIVLSSLAELPAEAARDRETFKHLGIKSELVLPLSAGGGPPIGALSFGTLRRERDWPDALVKRLRPVAEIFTNALARKRADQALRESEERMVLAADSAHFGVWVWNIARNQVWGSERWLRLFGLESGAGVRFETVLERIHPEDRETVKREVRQALAKRNDYAGEFRAVLPDGAQRWIASRGRGYMDAQGTPARMMGAAIDITERKRTENQLRQLSLAVEQSPVSVLITDLQGAIIYVNRKFSEVSGFSPEECVGQNSRILKSRETPTATYQELWACITGGRTWRGEIQNRRKNGELYWEWEVISPMLDAVGKITHFVGVKEDITERKRAEEAFRASEARLATGVELAGLGFVEVDEGGNTVFAADRFREILGVPRDWEQGMQIVQFWEDHLHPDDRSNVLEARTKLQAGKDERVSIEYRYLHPTQGEKWIHHLARIAARSSDNLPVRWFCAIRDITSQKGAEADLLRSFSEIERLKDRLQAESDYLKAEVKVTQAHGEIIGRSAGIRMVLSQAEQVAPTDSTVLISGETGTGKELVAETIHRLSSRSAHVMVKVNCAALPASLVESELFGREKGAYTGALMRQIGRFELADGATIFLDEVGELSLDVQAKLLRVLQEGQFERLGSPRTIKVNVRLIGATNRDLREEVRKGRFREDLYYRLNVFPIRVPPLRDRTEDIPLLVWAFLENFSSRMGRNITQVSRKTMEMLQRHHWPGNVRELRNVIEHSTIISTSETLRVPMLEQPVAEAIPAQTLAESERELIIKALEQTHGRIKGPRGAAALLGLNSSTLYGRMRKLGILNRRGNGEVGG